MRYNCAVNRAKLVDEPIVEMLLSRRFLKSGLKFMKADIQSDFNGTDIICYFNGIRRNLNVKRNSSKYFDSPNFTITVDKSKISQYKETMFIFIDEVADSLYMVDGDQLFTYILSKSSKLRPTKKENMFFLVTPKSDVISLVSSKDRIIKYNKNIARLFETGRNEEQFRGLSEIGG